MSPLTKLRCITLFLYQNISSLTGLVANPVRDDILVEVKDEMARVPLGMTYSNNRKKLFWPDESERYVMPDGTTASFFFYFYRYVVPGGALTGLGYLDILFFYRYIVPTALK
jgi:hypothetical protein